MVMYQCEKCNYTTNQKYNFIKHLNRKKPCISQYIHKVSNINVPPKTSKTLQNAISTPPKTSKNLQNSQDLTCNFCGKIFNRRDNLTRHINNRCKIIKNQINEYNSEKSKWEDEKKELENKTIELEKKVQQLNNDLINKPQQIITNTTNHNNYNTQNININSYGNETIEHLNGDYFKSLIGVPYDAVPKLIKDIHCNPDVPQNHNLRKTNKKDKYIEYYDGKDWIMEDKRKQLDHLVDMTFTILENTVDIENDIDSKYLEQFNIFRDKYYENRDNIKTNDINEAELLIINNSSSKNK